jgi:hypothetical protein
VTLFTANDLKSKSKKARAPGRDRRRRRSIPTGEPRLVESSRDRDGRIAALAWEALIDAIRESAVARLELLRGRQGSDRLVCPWERFMVCDVGCRCRGSRTVTVAFLRAHYMRLASEIALFGHPVHREVSK